MFRLGVNILAVILVTIFVALLLMRDGPAAFVLALLGGPLLFALEITARWLEQREGQRDQRPGFEVLPLDPRRPQPPGSPR